MMEFAPNEREENRRAGDERRDGKGDDQVRRAHFGTHASVASLYATTKPATTPHASPVRM